MAANAVASQIVQLEQFVKSKLIGIYIAMDGELDTGPIIHVADALNKNLYLPVLQHKELHEAQVLEFHPYKLGEDLSKNRIGFREPRIKNRSPIDPRLLDLVIIPLVAFDKNCNRLGRGAGHYDRTFEFLGEKNFNKLNKPFLLGLSYEFQLISEIKPSSWDIPLHMVITDQTIYAP